MTAEKFFITLAVLFSATNAVAEEGDPCDFVSDGTRTFSWHRVMDCYKSVPFFRSDLEQIVGNNVVIEIGADPRRELPDQLGIEVNELDEVVVDKYGRTNVEGVFAAGDLTDSSGDLKQTITAAASGAMAATGAYEYVSQHGNRCKCHSWGYDLDRAAD